MNKTQRIKINPLNTNTDKHIKINLEQNVKTLEFLSLKIGSDDIYRSFNADYGIVVGRVLANGGVGIPNAKISVFIPLDEEDETNSDILSVYPYKTPRDKNNEGKRYNLLPRVGMINDRGSISPKQPFGSFPTKPEIVTNKTILNVYKKYYKYTTITNDSGDYMIFGVPIGVQTIHLSVDITDIGEFSMNPASMVINLGYSSNLFTDNNTRIKPSNDLDDLPHIETQEITVDVIPFWGDVENYEIGITRQDFRIKATLVPQIIIFGSAFTDADNTMWGGGKNTKDKDMATFFRLNESSYYDDDDSDGFDSSTKRVGKITETIYYYPSDIPDDKIDMGLQDNESGVDPKDAMKILDKSVYSAYYRNGDFVFIINCNRKKILTNENGSNIETTYDDINGVFTEFRGFITFEFTNEDIPMNVREKKKVNGRTWSGFRTKIKVPQWSTEMYNNYALKLGTGVFNTLPDDLKTKKWRKQHTIFKKGTKYSVAKFNPIVYSRGVQNNANFHSDTDPDSGFIKDNYINRFMKDSGRPYHHTGIIYNNPNDDVNIKKNMHLPNNCGDGPKYFFGANWLNLSLYLPQIATPSKPINNVRVNTYLTNDIKTSRMINNNSTYIINESDNISRYLRNDIHWTDFIEVSDNDISEFSKKSHKGFNYKSNIDQYRSGNSKSKPEYFPHQCPRYGGKINADVHLSDPNVYFYKGSGKSDCIQFLIDLGIVKF